MKRSKSLSTAVGHHSHYLSIFTVAGLSLDLPGSNHGEWSAPTNQTHSEFVKTPVTWCSNYTTANCLFYPSTTLLQRRSCHSQHKSKKQANYWEKMKLVHCLQAAISIGTARWKLSLKGMVRERLQSINGWCEGTLRNWMMSMAPLKFPTCYFKKNLQKHYVFKKCRHPAVEVQCVANYHCLDNGCKMYSPKYPTPE